MYQPVNIDYSVAQVRSAMGEFEVLPICEEDTDDVMSLLERTFFVDEPLNQAIGLCENSRCTELVAYCKKSLLEGLSYKAVDKERNIVGVIISGVSPLKEDDGRKLIREAQSCQNAKFQKILYILARREEGSRLWEKFPEDEKLVDVKVAATDPGWRRRGIMNELLKITEETTKQRGIRLLRMDCSSAYSAKSAERLGFTCMYSAKYTDIIMDGKPLIVPEAPHMYDTVYIKTLYEK